MPPISAVGIETRLRHSREGGNPTPERQAYSAPFSKPIVPVMDSRLRGNDEVF